MEVMDTPTTLTIDSAEAAGLAAKLSAPTGDSVAEAVVKALRAEVERRERERERDVEAGVQRVLAIAEEIRAHLKEPIGSDTSDFYDENGFPA